MTDDEALKLVRALGAAGTPIRCNAYEYQENVRRVLHDMAAKWVDQGQDIRAVLALEEVRRLDGKFNQ
jgi:hypothetical protein